MDNLELIRKLLYLSYYKVKKDDIIFERNDGVSLSSFLVRNKLKNGRKQFYEGALKCEEFSNGKKYYNGEKGTEHLIKIEFSEDIYQLQFIFYGEKDKEKIIRVESSSGLKQFFTGEKDEEHLVCMEYPDGQKQFYTGDKDNEYKVYTELSNGEKQIYEGEINNQYIARIEYPDGKINFLNGKKDCEYLVRTEFPNGDKSFYKGKCYGIEHKVRTECLDGTKIYYRGEKDKEYIYKKKYVNGLKEIYKGEKGKEYLVHTEFPNNSTLNEKRNEHINKYNKNLEKELEEEREKDKLRKIRAINSREERNRQQELDNLKYNFANNNASNNKNQVNPIEQPKNMEKDIRKIQWKESSTERRQIFEEKQKKNKRDAEILKIQEAILLSKKQYKELSEYKELRKQKLPSNHTLGEFLPILMQ